MLGYREGKALPAARIPGMINLRRLLVRPHTLASVNRDVAQSELDRVVKELSDLEPALDKSKKAQAEVNEAVDHTIEEICSNIHNHTRNMLATTISRVAEEDLGVPYPGLLQAFHYADLLKCAMLDQLSATVSACEDHARGQTSEGVGAIQSFRRDHLGPDESVDNMTFRADLMFRKKRDALARQVDTSVEFWDFFDLAGLVQRQEKVAGTL